MAGLFSATAFIVFDLELAESTEPSLARGFQNSTLK